MQDKSDIENKIMSNQELAEKLRKSIIRQFVKRKVHSYFINNNWGADLVDMQFITKYNKGFSFLLCVTDIFSKYGRGAPLKDKKYITMQCFPKRFRRIKPQTKENMGI